MATKKVVKKPAKKAQNEPKTIPATREGYKKMASILAGCVVFCAEGLGG